ncbi:hypothetical protein AYO40_05045 [Planctomycetaceae bacterium SCGC AG-212-D15]|nr:hypothetical protein AYO40_05045 [Planctomycetaceae bacterium SCGC AG-212-D15]
MRQKSLFAWEEHTIEDVQTVLDPVQPLLYQAIMDPWRDLEQSRLTDPRFRVMPPGGIAQFLHYQIVARVRQLFPPDETSPEDGAVCFVDPSGMFHLGFKCTELTFKKLDKNFQRSNYLTWGNENYWGQRLLPGMPHDIKLIVGYQWTDETATAIQRISVVCPGPKEVLWWYEIPAPATVSKIQQPTLVPSPDAFVTKVQSEDGTVKGFRVKGKKKKISRNPGS